MTRCHSNASTNGGDTHTTANETLSVIARTKALSLSLGLGLGLALLSNRDASELASFVASLGDYLCLSSSVIGSR